MDRPGAVVAEQLVDGAQRVGLIAALDPVVGGQALAGVLIEKGELAMNIAGAMNGEGVRGRHHRRRQRRRRSKPEKIAAPDRRNRFTPKILDRHETSFRSEAKQGQQKR